MAPKSFLLTDAVSDYLLAHAAPLDAVERSLIEATAALGAAAGMQIAPEQGHLMRLLAAATGAKRAIEVGTFTGYSALQLVRGMGAGSHLHCFDVSEEWTTIARAHWERAGIADQITLVLGDAREHVAALPLEPTYDLAFIDADKPGYLTYYEAIVPRMRPGGLVLVDNVLWHGAVCDPNDHATSTETIRAFNDHVARDVRVDSAISPVGDGLTVVVVRAPSAFTNS